MSWKNRSYTTGEIVSFDYIQTDLNFQQTFVWDLDKTYLDTKIDSLWGLINAVVERSFTKKNIPGTNVLIRALAKNWQKEKGLTKFPIFFITASPPQMEERIIEKLNFDEIYPLGCYFKNNLINLKPSRWHRLKRHVGYKISALLLLRTKLPENLEQVLWGDDSESDAIIYNLYSDICARRISAVELKILLKKLGMAQDNMDLILQLQSQVPAMDPVKKIYINLAIDTDHDYYLKFGRRTVATYNTFQIALDLFQDGRINVDDVYDVYIEMVKHYQYSHEELLKSMQEFIKRPQIGRQATEEFVSFLKTKLVVAQEFDYMSVAKEVVAVDSDSRVRDLEGQFEPWLQERIDYLNEYR